MLNWLKKSALSPSSLSLSSCGFRISPEGLSVFCEQSDIPLKAPKTMAEALWFCRDALLEQGLAIPASELPAGADLENATTNPEIFIAFSALRFLKAGFAAISSGTDDFPEIIDANLSDFLPPITEMMLRLEPSESRLLAQDLNLELSFWHEGNRETPKRTGPLLSFAGQHSLLNETQWRLCQIAEQFNQSANKGGIDNYSTLAEIYEQFGLPMADGAENRARLTGMLEDTVILAPSRISMGWQADSQSSDTTHSAYPVIPDLPVANQEQARAFEAAFRKEFFQDGDAKAVYSIPPLQLAGDSSPRRMQILLPPAVREAASQMRQSLRGLTQPKAQQIALNPRLQFEGISSDALDFNLSEYGPRVTGLGPLVFRPVVKTQSKDSLLPESWSDSLDAANNPIDLEEEVTTNALSTVAPIHIEVQTPTGETRSVPLSDEQLKELEQRIEDSLETGNSMVAFTGLNEQPFVLEATPALLEQIHAAQQNQEVEAEIGSPVSGKNHNRHLTRLENEDENKYVEFSELEASPANGIQPLVSPQALVSNLPDGNPLKLDIYQQDGIAWLQTSFARRKPGVLLADDMGLGKTLQVLTFLAWLIESGWQTQALMDRGKASSVWQSSLTQEAQKNDLLRHTHPILVMMPKMLLDNWESEIKKFFRNQGEIFKPFEILDSQKIKQYRMPRTEGNDFKTGVGNLNPDYLQSNRLIIANYDTVKNYYHSFARIRWACIVMDESQALKNSSSALSQVISTICSNARFKITMTGTPIENDLMDLWTLFDIAVPGLLPPQNAFRKTFYKETEQSLGHDWDMPAIRKALYCYGGLNQPQSASYVLGRSKTEFLSGELPALIDLSLDNHSVNINGGGMASSDAPPINCHFFYQFDEWHQQENILAKIRAEKSVAKQLKAIQAIKSFAEHPWLALRHSEPQTIQTITTETLLENSSKFCWLLETLKVISHRKEKALIFTRSLTMQRWICDLLREHFRVDYRPINGMISKKGDNSTMAILKRFEAEPGFSVLVLSPEVAGVGLNITAANHVIHYGRWWNPAKEDQATCRAYRKGQKRPVYLYVPIGHGPNGEEGFDARLDRRMRLKAAMRQDFLSPVGDLEDEDLYSEEPVVTGRANTVSLG
jgi:SNF2 family DNA or RNA helicase